MKRILCLFMTLVMFMSSGLKINATDNSENTISQSNMSMLEYLDTKNNEILLSTKNYNYLLFIEAFKSDVASLYALEMVDLFIGSGTEPDKQKYIEVLVNIIATYDKDNATSLAEQNQRDNLKSFKDYAMDFAEISANAVSVAVSTNSNASQFETDISTAVNGLMVLTENTNNWINALSDLETMIQNYSKYDGFLELIENSAEGELRLAAKELRESMMFAFEKQLSTYLDISDKNFENYEEFFFTDFQFNVLKKTQDYASDDSIKFFVDCGDNIISKIGLLEDSWELGKGIGKLVGNVVVGGEDLINRVLELMALYEISQILKDEIIDLERDFLNQFEKGSQTETINKYIYFSQYLIGCRIRGEYCLYSIIANDAGLLSWFGKNNAKEAEEWYKLSTKNILNIQNALLEINTKEIDDMDNFDVYEAYQKIIDEYVSAIDAGESYESSSPEFPNVNAIAMLQKRNYNIDIKYALYDIDGNGIEELLFTNDEKYDCIMDIYTFDRTSANKLFNDDTLAERSHLTIYEDGTIYIYGSGGAAYGSATFYKIIDGGYDVMIAEKYSFDSILYPDTPFYNDNELLSDEQFYMKFSELLEVTGYQWKDLNDKLCDSEDSSNKISDISDEEIFELLKEYYKNGTEDDSNVTVIEGSSNESSNIYETQIRCGVPGNQEASQMLYWITVDKNTGNVTEENQISGEIKNYKLF